MSFFQIYKPSPHLSHVVEYYWRSILSLKESLIQNVPTPLMQGMTFNLNRLTEKMVFGNKTQVMDDYCYLFGQPTGHRLSHSHMSGVDIFGVKFTLTGIYALGDVEMKEVADAIVPADCIWGREIEWLCEAMYGASDTAGMISEVEQFLGAKLKQKQWISAQSLEHIVQYIQSERIYSVKDILDKVYLSERTMQRHFINQIGVSPKQYAQICRYNAVRENLANDPKIDWFEIVCNYGYHDQSHFVKEFKKFSGKTPAQYVESILTPSLTLF